MVKNKKKSRWLSTKFQNQWLAIVKKQGSEGAIFNVKGKIIHTFYDLDTQSTGFEKKWQNLDISGQVIALRLPNSPDWPAILLALWRIGAIPLLLPAYCNPSATKISNDSEPIETLGGATWRLVSHAANEYSLETLPNPPAHFPWDADLLKVTSGTSGTPRLIGFTMEQLEADAQQICANMEITPEDRNYGIIPFSHSYGFSNLITPLLFFGIPLVCATDAMPQALAEGLKQSQATVWPAVPAMLSALLASGFTGTPDLRVCISAGAPLPQSTATRFLKQTGSPVHGFYGCSECGGICYDRAGRCHEIEGWVGSSMNAVSLTLLPSEVAEQSQLAIRGASLGQGYFPSSPSDSLQNGTFYSSDLVAQIEDGFCLLGRSDDFINVGGQKLHPATVERTLLEIPEVHAALVFGIPSTNGRGEEIVALVEANDIQVEQLHRIIRSNLPAWQCPRTIEILEKIPLNERGKVNRRVLAQQWKRP